jgi:hypothetical protein
MNLKINEIKGAVFDEPEILEEASEIESFDDSERDVSFINWRNKRTRRIIGRRRLLKLYNATKNWFGSGAWYDDRNNRIRRYYGNSKSLRQSCNRRFRRRMNRSLDAVSNGAAYRRYVDYWWELF